MSETVEKFQKYLNNFKTYKNAEYWQEFQIKAMKQYESIHNKWHLTNFSEIMLSSSQIMEYNKNIYESSTLVRWIIYFIRRILQCVLFILLFIGFTFINLGFPKANNEYLDLELKNRVENTMFCELNRTIFQRSFITDNTVEYQSLRFAQRPSV